MAVNLSPRQFMDPDLPAMVAGVLERSGIAPPLLELEITESVMSPDMEAALAKLTAIRRLGLRLAIDDFGTGYSSLSQLKRLPIDVLKIDRSFIKGIPHVREDVAITEAILALGRTLGVRIVAEGVETAEQEAFLAARHCHEMQGFYFSPAVPPLDVARLLLTDAQPTSAGLARTGLRGSRTPSARPRQRQTGRPGGQMQRLAHSWNACFTIRSSPE